MFFIIAGLLMWGQGAWVMLAGEGIAGKLVLSPEMTAVLMATLGGFCIGFGLVDLWFRRRGSK